MGLKLKTGIRFVLAPGLFLLGFYSVIAADIIGWYPSTLISSKVYSYSVASMQKKENNVFFVSAGLEETFKPEEASLYNINLLRFNGSGTKKIPVATISLPASRFRFSLRPTVAISESKIMVFWQEPAQEKVGSRVMYSIGDRSTLVFSEPAQFAEKLSASSPYVLVDNKGIFYIFYQSFSRASKLGKFFIKFTKYDKDRFSKSLSVISDPSSIGKGVFFPAIFIVESQIHVLYQSKQSTSLKDEIFYIKSENSGKSFSKPVQLTTNDVNDFSPMAIYKNEELDWVWQSDSDTGYVINSSLSKKIQLNISESNSNSYNPVLVHSKKAGYIIAWHDFRVSPPQIFARFVNKPEDTIIGKPHQATDHKLSSSKTSFVKLGGRVYLIYQSGSTLYAKLADIYTSEIKITSKTHSRGKYSNTDKVVFDLELLSEPSGVKDFAFLIDHRPNSDPGIINMRGESRTIEKAGLESGSYFLHVKYIDRAGNRSKIYRYPFLVDVEKPEPPEIVSDTHLPGEASDNLKFHATFKSNDNVGIKGYRYKFTHNIGDAPDQFTKTGEITVDNLEPGQYFFIVRAEDNAGNVSVTANYLVDIRYPDAEDFLITSSIRAGNVGKSILTVTVTGLRDEKKIVRLNGGITTEKRDPTEKGKLIPSEKSDNALTAVIDLHKLKPGFYVFNLGVVYADGTKSYPRYLYFLYNPPDWDKQHPTAGRRLSIPSYIFSLRPSITVQNIGSLYEVSFKLPSNVQKKYGRSLKGFSYAFSQTPRKPSGQLNYGKTPIYFYDLKPGEYYITVIPVFKGGKTEPDAFSYYRFEVGTASVFPQKILIIILLVVLFLFIILINRKKIRFYMSRI
ncbi:MAG: hypothetical protein ABUK01_01590 [Leptospirales bacterium]